MNPSNIQLNCPLYQFRLANTSTFHLATHFISSGWQTLLSIVSVQAGKHFYIPSGYPCISSGWQTLLPSIWLSIVSIQAGKHFYLPSGYPLYQFRLANISTFHLATHCISSSWQTLLPSIWLPIVLVQATNTSTFHLATHCISSGYKHFYLPSGYPLYQFRLANTSTFHLATHCISSGWWTLWSSTWLTVPFSEHLYLPPGTLCYPLYKLTQNLNISPDKLKLIFISVDNQNIMMNLIGLASPSNYLD